MVHFSESKKYTATSLTEAYTNANADSIMQNGGVFDKLGDQRNVGLGKMYHRWSTMARWASTNVEFARIFTLTTDGTFFRVQE